MKKLQIYPELNDYRLIPVIWGVFRVFTSISVKCVTGNKLSPFKFTTFEIL